jgi:hypothetical protein
MHKVHARHGHAGIKNSSCALRPRRPPAELGRYTDVGCGGISLGEVESSGVRRPGLFTAAPVVPSSTLSASQRTVGACCDTSRDSGQQRCSARDSVSGSSSPLRSSPLISRQVLGCGSFRAFSNPLGITSRCSRTGFDKVHAPHCSSSFTFSVRAPQVRRPAAELGRYITVPVLRTFGVHGAR